MCPLPLRQEAWRRLETDLDRGKIAAMTTEIGLARRHPPPARIVAAKYVVVLWLKFGEQPRRFGGDLAEIDDGCGAVW